MEFLTTFLDFLWTLWNGIANAFTDIIDEILKGLGYFAQVTITVAELRDKMDDIVFGSNNVVVLFLGNVRYVIGDQLYVLIFVMFTILGSFAFYKLVRTAFTMVMDMIPMIRHLLPF